MQHAVPGAGGRGGDLVQAGFAKGVAVGIGPVAAFDPGRGILHEGGHEMLARRDHGGVDHGRDHQVLDRVAAEAAGRPDVIGAFPARDQIGDVKVAADVRRPVGQGGKRGRGIERDGELARGAARLEPPDGAQDGRVEAGFRDITQEGALGILARDDTGGADDLCVVKFGAGRPARRCCGSALRPEQSGSRPPRRPSQASSAGSCGWKRAGSGGVRISSGRMTRQCRITSRASRANGGRIRAGWRHGRGTCRDSRPPGQRWHRLRRAGPGARIRGRSRSCMISGRKSEQTEEQMEGGNRGRTSGRRRRQARCPRPR